MPARPNVRQFRNLRFSEKLKEPAGENLLEDRTEAPEPPVDLSPSAAIHYRRIARQMQAAGSWSGTFEVTLAVFSALLAEFHEEGPNFSATKLVQLRLLAGDLGLTPSHSHRVTKN